jgi:hypothetical protein
MIIFIIVIMCKFFSMLSSANYDVELFHEADSHLRLLGDAADMILAAREGAEYQTCTLKWCTPRGNSASELHHSSGTFR